MVAPIVLVVLGILSLLFLWQRSRSPVKLQPADGVKIKRSVKREKKDYTAEQVAEHCTAEDAWIILRHKASGERRVYDVTDYLEEHPGGESILKHAGHDSTEGFHGPQHPATVKVLVEEYCIGKVVDQQVEPSTVEQ